MATYGAFANDPFLLSEGVRHLVPPLLSLLLTGCPDRAPSPSPRLDLTRPAASPAPRAILGPVALETNADFDKLEDNFLERRAPESLVTALTMMAEVTLAQPAGSPIAERDALLLMRLSMLHMALADDASQRGQDPRAFSEKALSLARSLTDRAPESPHALFLQGVIPFSQIGGSDRRDAFVDPSDLVRKPLRDAVVTRWRKLLAQTPTYQGPRGYTPERIAAAANQIEAASAEITPSTRPVAAARPATMAESGALSELSRLMHAPEGVRTTTCRDWMRTRKEDEPLALARLSLFCTTHQGDAARAIPLIARLDAEDPGAFDACLALRRLSDKAPAELVAEALGKSPLVGRCSP